MESRANHALGAPPAPSVYKIRSGEDQERHEDVDAITEEYGVYHQLGSRDLAKQDLTHSVALINPKHDLPPFLLRVWPPFQNLHAQLMCGC